MQDYWNDPPEYPEVPECCDQEMIVGEDGSYQCEICAMKILAAKDIEDMGYVEELSDDLQYRLRRLSDEKDLWMQEAMRWRDIA